MLDIIINYLSRRKEFKRHSMMSVIMTSIFDNIPTFSSLIILYEQIFIEETRHVRGE